MHQVCASPGKAPAQRTAEPDCYTGGLLPPHAAGEHTVKMQLKPSAPTPVLPTQIHKALNFLEKVKNGFLLVRSLETGSTNEAHSVRRGYRGYRRFPTQRAASKKAGRSKGTQFIHRTMELL